ncbi:unnamed protein product [Bathycoccus prasinos]
MLSKPWLPENFELRGKQALDYSWLPIESDMKEWKILVSDITQIWKNQTIAFIGDSNTQAQFTALVCIFHVLYDVLLLNSGAHYTRDATCGPIGSGRWDCTHFCSPGVTDAILLFKTGCSSLSASSAALCALDFQGTVSHARTQRERIGVFRMCVTVGVLCLTVVVPFQAGEKEKAWFRREQKARGRERKRQKEEEEVFAEEPDKEEQIRLSRKKNRLVSAPPFLGEKSRFSQSRDIPWDAQCSIKLHYLTRHASHMQKQNCEVTKASIKGYRKAKFMKKHSESLREYSVVRGGVSMPLWEVSVKGKQFAFLGGTGTRYRASTFHDKEPGTINWIKSFNSDETFVDIGANIGIYSIFAAKYVNTVIAIEPHLGNVYHLLLNIVENRLCNILPLSIGLSKETGFVHFEYRNTNPAVSQSQLRIEDNHHDVSYGEVSERSAYKDLELKFAASMDDLIKSKIIESPEHIKIDVDGIEFQILQGMKGVLRSGRIISLLIETEDVEALKIYNFMIGLGYILFRIDLFKDEFGKNVELNKYGLPKVFQRMDECTIKFTCTDYMQKSLVTGLKIKTQNK